MSAFLLNAVTLGTFQASAVLPNVVALYMELPCSEEIIAVTGASVFTRVMCPPGANVIKLFTAVIYKFS
jgi:hypothetical protein